MLKTMVWHDNQLELLDQTQLPLKIATIVCTDYKQIANAIQKMEVRGAPAIGAAAAFAMVLGWNSLLKEKVEPYNLLERYTLIKEELIATRPTAVNLAWAANKLYNLAEKLTLESSSVEDIAKQLNNLAKDIYEQDIVINKKIGQYGAELLPLQASVLTHCNAGALATCGWGTALGVVRTAFAQNKISMVYVDETRPLLQGARLTAWELENDHIPATLITDNMAAWVMHTQKIDAVIVGADRIAANGDTANKIGTYGVAILAAQHKIPFYIAAPCNTFDFTIDSGNHIPIEERSEDEVRVIQEVPTAPQSVKVFNPAFDITPADLIAGIITEYGVITAPYQENIQKLQQKIIREAI